MNPPQAVGVCELRSAHPKNLAEQDSVDGVDRAIDCSPQRAQQHVGPFRLVVLEDTCYWRRLDVFIWIILVFLLKNALQSHSFPQGSL